MATHQRRLDWKVKEAIDEMLARELGPREIHQYLEEESAKEGLELYGRTVPSLKTVQRYVSDHIAKDSSEAWSLATADGGDARVVLSALAAAADYTSGRKRHLTQREAAWVLRVGRAAPFLPPLFVYRLARMYMLLEDNRLPSDDLDLLLGYAPWEPGGKSPNERKDYFMRAVEAGWISAGPAMALVNMTAALDPSPADDWLLKLKESYAKMREKGADSAKRGRQKL